MRALAGVIALLQTRLQLLLQRGQSLRCNLAAERGEQRIAAALRQILRMHRRQHQLTDQREDAEINQQATVAERTWHGRHSASSCLCRRQKNPAHDRKSTRLNPVTTAHIVCRLLREKKKKKKIKIPN